MSKIAQQMDLNKLIRDVQDRQSQIVTNPVEALKLTAKENSELHEELAKIYAELDRYRSALTMIMQMPYAPAVNVATKALGQRPVVES